MLFNRQKQTFLDNVIFVDIDDTLADTRRAVYDLYVKTTGDKSGDINVKSKRYANFCPQWSDDEVSKLFSTSIIYEDIKPMAGAKEAIQALKFMGYDVRIATLHTASGIYNKQKWIEKHFPTLAQNVYYITNVNGGNKDVFKGRAIIDDDSRNTDSNQSVQPLLLDVYGIYSTREGQPAYCKTWKDVVDKLK